MAQSSIYCSFCQLHRPRGDFTDTAIRKHSGRGDLVPDDSMIKCLLHTGGSSMRCAGPCNQLRPLTAFSKRSRRKNEKNWCNNCVAWQLSDERNADRDYQVPYAAPDNHRNADEIPDHFDREDLGSEQIWAREGDAASSYTPQGEATGQPVTGGDSGSGSENMAPNFGFLSTAFDLSHVKKALDDSDENEDAGSQFKPSSHNPSSAPSMTAAAPDQASSRAPADKPSSAQRSSAQRSSVQRSSVQPLSRTRQGGEITTEYPTTFTTGRGWAKPKSRKTPLAAPPSYLDRKKMGEPGRDDDESDDGW